MHPLSCPTGFLAATAVVMPALDEEACVAATVERWRSLGARWVRVVDNGSRDATETVAREAGAEVVREERRGYGAAAWRGIQGLPGEARWILFGSADGSDVLDAREVSQWEDALRSGADFVLGDRFARPESRRELKASQRLGNRFTCFLIWLGWGRWFRDLGSLRLCRREALEGLGLEDRGFGWNVEMQVRALEAGLRLVEVPVTYHPRLAGESKISGHWLGIIRAGAGMLRMTAFLWRRRGSRRRRLAELRVAPARERPST